MEILTNEKSKLIKVAVILMIILSVYFIVGIITKIKNYSMLGESSQPATISFSGHGEVTAVPDIANINFSINKDAKTAKEAQDLVAQVENKSLEFLKSSGVEDKDIKTSNASFYPKYEYKYDTKTTLPPCTQYNCPPVPGKNVIVGYTAGESIDVKVRNTDDVGKIMQGLGTIGVSNLNGPNFSIDNEDALKAEARKKAIIDAKTKAEVLAKDLGVTLGKISSFNESGNYPIPMYAKTMMAEGVSDSSAPAQIPKGENTITSDVNITYEIQ